MEFKTCEEYVLNELLNTQNELSTTSEKLNQALSAIQSKDATINTLVGFIVRRIKTSETGLSMDQVLINDSMSQEDAADVNLIYTIFDQLKQSQEADSEAR